MKKSTAFLVFYFVYSVVFSQDLIYTISADIEEQKTALDSILVENLTNDSWIIFSDLPHLESYRINLTKKELLGNTGLAGFNRSSGFIEYENRPGEIKLAYFNNIPVMAGFSIYNMKGQKVYADKKLVYTGNSVCFRLSDAEMYIVKVETPADVRTFKAIGSSDVNSFDIQISAERYNSKVIKSSLLNSDNNFEYSVGDSIRISVFKDELFAEPVKFEISGSDFLNFMFELSNDTSLVVTSGKIDIEGLDNFNFSEISALTVEGLSSVKVNGIFQVKNKTVGVERQLPVFFTKGDDLVFGFQPVKTSNNVVTMDDILLFFYNLFPDIRLQEFQQAHLMELIQDDSNYGTLKNKILVALENNNSPVLDTVFVSVLNESVATVAQLLLEETKSAEFTLDGTFQFDFKRDGEITWPEDIPLFAALGFDIRRVSDNTVVYGPKILQPRKVILSLGSAIEWGFNKIFKNFVKTPPESFKFATNGDYVITLTNGKYEGNNPDKLHDEVSTYNRNHFIADLVAVIIPQDIANMLIGDCGASLYSFFTSNTKDFLVNVFLKDDVTKKFVADQVYGIFENMIGILHDCAKGGKEINFLKTLSKTIENLNVLSKAENLTKAITMAHDYWGSDISAEETRFYYDKVSFGILEYNRTSPAAFSGKPGSVHQLNATVYERSVSYDFDFQPLSTIFQPNYERFTEADGVPFDIAYRTGNLYMKRDKAVTAEGKLNVGLTMGDNNATVIIKPAFENSGLDPDEIQMTVDDDDICSSNWYAAYYEKSIAMTNAGIAYALNQTPATCNSYKQAIQDVLDELALYKDCDWGEEENESYQLTVDYVTNSMNDLDCN